MKVEFIKVNLIMENAEFKAGHNDAILSLVSTINNNGEGDINRELLLSKINSMFINKGYDNLYCIGFNNSLACIYAELLTLLYSNINSDFFIEKIELSLIPMFND